MACRLRLTALVMATIILASCKTELYHDLQEQEANEMLAILLEAHIDAEKFTVKGDLFGINVEEKQFAHAMTVLQDRGYPRPQFDGVSEMFKNDSRISSSLEQRARLNYALTQELSETLSAIDGVLTARVHSSLPDDATSHKKEIKSSAAVFIRYDDRYDIHDLVPRIKNLVARSLAHVDYTDIAVVLIAAHPLTMFSDGVSDDKP